MRRRSANLYILSLFLLASLFFSPDRLQGSPAPDPSITLEDIKVLGGGKTPFGVQRYHDQLVEDEVVVKFKNNVDDADLFASKDLSVKAKDSVTGVGLLKLSRGLSLDGTLKYLSRDSRVDWAEPNYLYRIAAPPQAIIAPNDVRYSTYQKQYLDLVKAEQGWGVEQGKESITIAVLDTGVGCYHQDLGARMWQNPQEIAGNLIDDDRNGYIDDVYGYDFAGADIGSLQASDDPGDGNPCIFAADPAAGNGLDDDGDGDADGAVYHGTAVAGIIAAQTNNSTGIAGICWRCKIMAVRVMNPEGLGRSNDLAKGIVYAAQNGAKIINISAGGSYSRAVQDAVETAHRLGSLVIASAGNENKTPMGFPANHPKVVGVAASDLDNQRASFSNWGSGTKPTDVTAPGVGITSTAVCSVALVNASVQACVSAGIGGGAYALGFLNGTSFSAPIVSGMAGLMLSVDPSLTNDAVANKLKSTASALPNDPADSPDAGAAWAGAGIVDMFKALSPSSVTVQAPTPTPSPIAPIATPTPVAGAGGPGPAIVSPQNGTLSSNMGLTLSWSLPEGATQYQIQINPFSNDGPAINLIRNAESSYIIASPELGVGNYVMLPGMTYTWRIRSTNSSVAVLENDSGWSNWTSSTFRTASPWSGGISALTPAHGQIVDSLTPTLVWNDSNNKLFYYEVQISKDPSFNNDPKTATAPVYWELRHGGMTTPLNSYTISSGQPLEAGTTYYWHVRARVQGDGTPVAWSDTWYLNTRP